MSAARPRSNGRSGCARESWRRTHSVRPAKCPCGVLGHLQPDAAIEEFERVRTLDGDGDCAGAGAGAAAGSQSNRWGVRAESMSFQILDEIL